MRVDVTSRFRELALVRPQVVVRRPGVFYVEATDLLNSLMELEKLLAKVKLKYLLPKYFIRTKGSRMSEEDKDELDADLVELIKNCSNKIDALKTAVEAQPVASSVGEYQREVVAYLLEVGTGELSKGDIVDEDYDAFYWQLKRLKNIADEAKQMQKKRYQQPFLLSPRLLPEDDRLELDALERDIVAMRKDEAKRKQIIATSPTNEHQGLASPKSPKSPLQNENSSPRSPVKQTKPEIRQRSTSKARKQAPAAQQPPVFASQNDDLKFTEEEDRRFRVENVMLHRHFQENLEDAKKMESKMAEISNLMGQFADKIMEQQTDIELIHQHAQETKSNVTQSNRILEQTQKIGQGYGFMIFCFYAGFSIILHMLHYFNN